MHSYVSKLIYYADDSIHPTIKYWRGTRNAAPSGALPRATVLILSQISARQSNSLSQGLVEGHLAVENTPITGDRV